MHMLTNVKIFTHEKDKRQELFEAARKLFLENGFKKTSVSEITSMAQVAVGTFYKYYDSKEQIFCEVYLAENERSKRVLSSTKSILANRPKPL